MQQMEKCPSFCQHYPQICSSCSSTLYILKVCNYMYAQHTCASVKVLVRDFLIKFSLLPKGEWVARFDPRFTSRGVFYLDDKNMVDVEVMEDAKHPLSLFIDNELDAQVTRSAIARSGWKSRRMNLTGLLLCRWQDFHSWSWWVCWWWCPRLARSTWICF